MVPTDVIISVFQQILFIINPEASLASQLSAHTDTQTSSGPTPGLVNDSPKGPIASSLMSSFKEALVVLQPTKDQNITSNHTTAPNNTTEMMGTVVSIRAPLYNSILSSGTIAHVRRRVQAAARPGPTSTRPYSPVDSTNMIVLSKDTTVSDTPTLLPPDLPSATIGHMIMSVDRVRVPSFRVMWELSL